MSMRSFAVVCLGGIGAMLLSVLMYRRGLLQHKQKTEQTLLQPLLYSGSVPRNTLPVVCLRTEKTKRFCVKQAKACISTSIHEMQLTVIVR